MRLWIKDIDYKSAKIYQEDSKNLHHENYSLIINGVSAFAQEKAGAKIYLYDYSRKPILAIECNAFSSMEVLGIT